MVTVPLSGLLQNDVLAIFAGPQIDTNYIGSRSPICEINLIGTGQVRVEANYTGIVVGTDTIPSPVAWTNLREVRGAGITQISLSPRTNPSWIRVILLQTGTGTCQVSARWDPPGSVVDPLRYLGLWNADLNDPEIVNEVGDRGGYYLVQVPGTTSIDGISTWAFGDRIVFNGFEWIKLENDIIGPAS